MKKIKLPLLARILIAIVLGIALGTLLNEGWVRVFVTFNSIFSQYLGFLIPLIIVGLVTPSIADIGSNAGRMLLVTLALAFGDTLLAGFLAYGTGESLFPAIVQSTANEAVGAATGLKPYFEIKIPAMLDVMSALVMSFMFGLGVAYSKGNALRGVFQEIREVVTKTISRTVIPLLPLYIFGIMLNMTYTGEVYHILSVFARIIVVILVLHIVIMLYEYIIAGIVSGRNPLKMLVGMLPAYFTALGTMSSAATIPVTHRQALKNGISEPVASFTIPLCSTIHLSGSMMKITACALTICMLNGLPHDFALFMQFILVLSVCMVAAPGVPGGAVMAALGPLGSILGFDAEMQALMIALYIAMDSFGTACNVTGDGAIALIVDKIFARSKD